MINLNQDLHTLSKTHRTYLFIIFCIIFFTLFRVSYGALTLSSTTITSDGTFNAVSTGNFNFSTTTANGDTIRITPATGGGASFTGILTSVDITGSNKTWTLPNQSGTLALAGGGASLDQHCDSAPDLTTGWGTGATLSSGSCDSSGIVNFGTGADGQNILTFSTAFANVPSCVISYGYNSFLSGDPHFAAVTETTTTTMTVAHYDNGGNPGPDATGPRLYYQCSSKP